MQLTGSEILVECLKEQGVDTVFGYPGGAADAAVRAGPGQAQRPCASSSPPAVLLVYCTQTAGLLVIAAGPARIN